MTKIRGLGTGSDSPEEISALAALCVGLLSEVQGTPGSSPRPEEM